MIVLYGIPNCDTVKKARNWLLENGIDYSFHDFKKLGAPKDLLVNCCDKFGWEKVLNRNGITYKKLSDNEKSEINTQEKAIDYMQKNPSSIKRPILQTGQLLLLGFTSDEYHIYKTNMHHES